MSQLARVIKLTSSILIVLVAVCSAIAQKQVAFSLFDSDSIRNAVLTSDFKLLIKNKYKEISQPATLQMLGEAGDTISYEVEIRSRGNRRKEVCAYPPFRMKFPKSQFQYNKLKWVIPCRQSDNADEQLLKEYICYKIYEELSDVALRTALLRVEYIDVGRKNKSEILYGYVIEHIDQLAERYEGREYSPVSLRERVLDQDQLALYTFFQYLIANTDWHISNSHNIKAITSPSEDAIYVVPYDFDYSGFVGTSYAVPHETVPIEDVKERYNKGSCMSEELCEKYRLFFLDKKDAILAVVSDDPYLDAKTKKQALFYLDPFFRLMESSRQTKSVFCVNCRNWQ